MAVELCKVSLWMEALEPGRPLSFLDHRIVLGNSLLGATPDLIAGGVPPDAFKAILGDDKKVVAALRKRNEQDLSGQLSFDVAGERVDADAHAIADQAAALAMSMIARSLGSANNSTASSSYSTARATASAACRRHVVHRLRRPKDTNSTAITQDTLSRVLSNGSGGLSPNELAAIRDAKAAYSFLHWHVAFPAVWEKGGFDVVLGNPPWERVKLQEKEFFAARSPAIANAPNKAARDRLIKRLEGR